MFFLQYHENGIAFFTVPRNKSMMSFTRRDFEVATGASNVFAKSWAEQVADNENGCNRWLWSKRVVFRSICPHVLWKTGALLRGATNSFGPDSKMCWQGKHPPHRHRATNPRSLYILFWQIPTNYYEAQLIPGRLALAARDPCGLQFAKLRNYVEWHFATWTSKAKTRTSFPSPLPRSSVPKCPKTKVSHFEFLFFWFDLFGPFPVKEREVKTVVAERETTNERRENLWSRRKGKVQPYLSFLLKIYRFILTVLGAQNTPKLCEWSGTVVWNPCALTVKRDCVTFEERCASAFGSIRFVCYIFVFLVQCWWRKYCLTLPLKGRHRFARPQRLSRWQSWRDFEIFWWRSS